MEIKVFALSSEDDKILEFTQYQKSDKTPFFIYADLWMFSRKDWLM